MSEIMLALLIKNLYVDLGSINLRRPIALRWKIIIKRNRKTRESLLNKDHSGRMRKTREAIKQPCR